MLGHSALPWEVVESNEHHGAYIVPAYGGDVCDLYAMSNPTAASVRNGGNSYPVHFDNSAGNAELIVRAVNAHSALVEALARALAEHDYKRTQQVMLTEPVWVDVARAALRLAKHGAASAATNEEEA